ncbi:hypothetical protein ACGFZP_30800 [Kitasatospora sp. NPDC048239]|uniref:hypothetical protein n=1 Tax=Kitasatospora sp. NPDC048239 TaxID=3364046 RepID=UPI003722DA85
MSTVIRTRRSRRSAAVAAALGAVALCGSVALSAPAAHAEAVKHATLAVHGPASVGLAGQPVEFTEAVTNTGTETSTYVLVLTATGGTGAPERAIAIDYQDPADGAWKPVPLERHADGSAGLSGTLPGGVTVPVGDTATRKLRINAEAGLPRDGASDGGLPSITLRSGLTAPGSRVLLAEQTRNIRTDSIPGTPADAPAAPAPAAMPSTAPAATPSTAPTAPDAPVAPATAGTGGNPALLGSVIGVPAIGAGALALARRLRRLRRS